MLRFGSHRFGSNRATHLKSPKNIPFSVQDMIGTQKSASFGVQRQQTARGGVASEMCALPVEIPYYWCLLAFYVKLGHPHPQINLKFKCGNIQPCKVLGTAPILDPPESDMYITRRPRQKQLHSAVRQIHIFVTQIQIVLEGFPEF